MLIFSGLFIKYSIGPVVDELGVKNFANYPNPFASVTNIFFTLDTAADNVEVMIYTISGRLIKQLPMGALGIGYNDITWNGTDEADNTVANGVYFYKITAIRGTTTKTVTGKMVKIQ